jgi:hypothetical protein
VAGIISRELAGFLESGLDLHLATRTRDLRPEGSIVWAVRVDSDRLHLDVFLDPGTGRRLLPALKQSRRMALAAGRPTDDRAVQIKGAFLDARPAARRERSLVERQVRGFMLELATIGISPSVADNWKLWPCLRLRMRIEEVFEQTPGPGAGEPLK